MKCQQRTSFSSQQDEIIIEYVRENEALYNFCNKKYSDTLYKNTLWNKIGQKLQQDPQQCKHRWESIRGQYRKIIKTKKTSTGQAADMRSKWKYEDLLQFLKPHMKDKQRLTSVVNESLTIVTDDEDESLSQDADISNSENPNMSALSTADIIDNTPKKIKPIKKKPKVDSRVDSTQQTAGSTLMNYLLQEEKNKSDQKDELDHFFDSIKGTVKKFLPSDKHLAKNRIFMIVSDIEAKYIDQQFPQHIPAYSTYSHNNLEHMVQFQVNPQFQQCQDQPPISSTHSYPSAAAMSMPSRPSSCVPSPQSSTASSYYENFSPTDND